MFGLPENPSRSKGASLNGNLLGVEEFSMLQPSKENRDLQSNKPIQKVSNTSPVVLKCCYYCLLFSLAKSFHKSGFHLSVESSFALSLLRSVIGLETRAIVSAN